MKQKLAAIIAAACKELFNIEPAVIVTRPDEEFGDYATNIALQVAKDLHESPRAVAEKLTATIQERASDTVSEVTIAGPGFINLRLRDQVLVDMQQLSPTQILQGKLIVTEYSDPNPFKVLHVGHLYTTIVGDAIARLLEAAGADIHRVNFGGDVGLHVAKSMWAIIRFLDGELPEKLQTVGDDPHARAAWLSTRYVEGNTAYETDDAAKAEIIAVNKRVYRLHTDDDHTSPFAQIYWTCREWSYAYFKVLYDELQVKPFEKYYPESVTTPTGIATVQEQLQRGVYEKSDGAVVFNGEKYGLHTRVFINSQGLPTYEAKDVGLIIQKWEDYHFDTSIVITANDIVEYMKVVQKSIEQFNPELTKRSKHITHGNIKMQGGAKMSSRKGNVLLALDVLAEARTANHAMTSQDNEETVLGAIKYAFLKQRIGGDIVYDPKESVSLEGNSGPYLQYAHARAKSILRKANASRPGSEDFTDLEPDERSLLRKLSEYSEVVDEAVTECMPHHVCTYLYALAQSFNKFYERNRVIGDTREATRVALVTRYTEVLATGLQLLGIVAPDSM